MGCRSVCEIDTWEQPLWPKLSRILFISLLVLSAAMLLVELKNALLPPVFDLRRFLRSLSLTLLSLWGVYSLLLALCCGLGCRANRRSYEKRKADSGIVDQNEEDRARSRRAVRRLNRDYLLYLRICGIGLAALGLLWLLSGLL